MPSSVALGLNPLGGFDVWAVDSNNNLVHFDQTTNSFTSTGLKELSISVAFNPSGQEELDVVQPDGSVLAFGPAAGAAAGTTLIPAGFGVISESVAFSTNGTRVRVLALSSNQVFDNFSTSPGTFNLIPTTTTAGSTVTSVSAAFVSVSSGSSAASLLGAAAGPSVLVDTVDSSGNVQRIDLGSSSAPAVAIASGVEADSIAPGSGGVVIQMVIKKGASPVPLIPAPETVVFTFGPNPAPFPNVLGTVP